MRISDWSSDVCSSDLLFQKLLLAADVAAIAFGGHVLTKGGYGFARDDPAADGRLNRNLEQVAGDQVLHPLAHVTAARNPFVLVSTMNALMPSNPLASGSVRAKTRM